MLSPNYSRKQWTRPDYHSSSPKAGPTSPTQLPSLHPLALDSLLATSLFSCWSTSCRTSSPSAYVEEARMMCPQVNTHASVVWFSRLTSTHTKSRWGCSLLSSMQRLQGVGYFQPVALPPQLVCQKGKPELGGRLWPLHAWPWTWWLTSLLLAFHWPELVTRPCLPARDLV